MRGSSPTPSELDAAAPARGAARRRPPAPPTGGEILVGRRFLALDRWDVVWLVALVAVAFFIRVASPIAPNFLTGTPGGAVSFGGLGFPSDQDITTDANPDEECTPNTTDKIAPGKPDSGGAPIGTPIPVPSGTSATNSDGTAVGVDVKACGFVFDEIYFPVDAAKDLHQPAVDYFDPEPPLAKLLIAPALACGDSTCVAHFTPWRWRISPAIAGSLFVGLVYLIARRLRRDRFFAVCAAGFVCFDGLALVESRTGVIDMIAVFFVALAYYLFLLHWQARTRRQWRVTLYLLAASIGLAMGAKLTALAPLAVGGAFVAFRLGEPLLARTPLSRSRLAPGVAAEGALWRGAAGGTVRGLLHYALAGLLAASVFFACFSRYSTIDHTVYRFTGCTIANGLTNDPPYVERKPGTVDIGPLHVPNVARAAGNAWDVMVAGLEYHNNECHDHPYASRWYTWPLTWKPVLFYLDTDDTPSPATLARAAKGDTSQPAVYLTSSVSNGGNPPMFWIGLLGLVWCAWWATGVLRRSWQIAACTVGAISLVGMAIAFNRAEGASLDATGAIDPVRVHPSPAFLLGFFGVALFCAVVLFCGVWGRRFVPAFIVVGYLVGWLMWAPGNERRVLFFYHMLGALPFVALAAAYGLTSLRRMRVGVGSRVYSMAPVAYAGVLVVLAGFVFFYPMWTGLPEFSADRALRLWPWLNW